MNSAEISGTNGNTLLIQSEDSRVVTIAVLGPRGGVLGSVNLTSKAAAEAATAIMRAYRAGFAEEGK